MRMGLLPHTYTHIRDQDEDTSGLLKGIECLNDIDVSQDLGVLLSIPGQVHTCSWAYRGYDVHGFW